jgi:hypothetical protein
MTAPRQVFDILAVGQAGRLQFEAVLLAASLRDSDPGFPGTLWIAEPEPGPLWPTDPRMDEGPRAALEALGARILPFASRDFGARYPQGNKIEALAALPDRPFLFLDTDTLVTGSFADVALDFDRPSASMRREPTWPKPRPGGPCASAIWKALYDRFGLDAAGSLDPAWPEGHWQRHLYFNAGWFFHRSPAAFGRRYRDIAVAIRDDPPPELAGQPLDPWLDQVALPLVIHGLGGGRPGTDLAGLDGAVTCHWRTLPLLYARESDHAVAVLEAVCARPEVRAGLAGHAPVRRMVDEGGGWRARALFDRDRLPATEQAIRQRLKRARLWLR